MWRKLFGILSMNRRLAGAIDAGIGEVFLAELLEIRGGQPLEDGGIARLLGIRIASLQLGHEAQNIRQLGRAFDLRVRGENLLQQASSRRAAIRR